MKMLVVVTALAAFAAQSAAACDLNREASAEDQVVATTDQSPQAAPTCNAPNCPAPQPTSVASEQKRNAVEETVPVVLITHRD
jgi:hypothetical protein